MGAVNSAQRAPKSGVQCCGLATGCNLQLRLLGINTHMWLSVPRMIPSNLNLYMIYHSFNFNFLGFSIPCLHSLHICFSHSAEMRESNRVWKSAQSLKAIFLIWGAYLHGRRKCIQTINYIIFKWIRRSCGATCTTSCAALSPYMWIGQSPPTPTHPHLHSFYGREKLWASSLCGSGPKSLIEVLIVWFLRISINFTFTER